MEKNKSTTPEEVRASVASLYSDILNKRRQQKAEKYERKAQEEIEKEEAKAAKEESEAAEPKMSKKEKRQAQIDSWKEVIIGLTGDDLEYRKEKKRSKKYRKWIDDEEGKNSVMVQKPKKHKKKDYNKEFAAELTMLKSLVADQNRFTADLQKRFQNAAGPATKDAMPLNKTMVELAAAINASRSNSLGVLREIGSVKKTIADLYMKQKKLDSETGAGGVTDSADLSLMGARIADSLYGDQTAMNLNPTQAMYETPVMGFTPTSIPAAQNIPQTPAVDPYSAKISSKFDPDSWDGPELAANSSAPFENIPHSYVVEWHKASGQARFKAVRDDTGEELIGCPVPTSDPSKLLFNEKDLTVKGEFDELFKLEIV